MLRLIKIIFLVLLAIQLIACGQSNAKKKAKFKLSIPSAMVLGSALTTGANQQVNYMAISVTGGGKPEMFWNWEGHCTGCTPPSLIELDVVEGPGRLAQAIVVIKDSTTSTESIYYGDTIFDAVLGTQDVTITASKMADISDNTEKKFVGRYLTATNAGPSGPVGAYLVVPNSKPPMKVMESYIYDGWFNFFVIDGIDFTYKLLTTGDVLFTSASSSGLAAQVGSAVMNVKSPATYGMELVKNSVGTVVESRSYGSGDKPLDMYVGFWANNPAYLSGKTVCYSGANGTNVHYGSWDEATPLGGSVSWSTSGTILDGFNTNFDSSMVGEYVVVQGTDYYVNSVTDALQMSVSSTLPTGQSFQPISIKNRHHFWGIFSDSNGTTPLKWYPTTHVNAATNLHRVGGGVSSCSGVIFDDYIEFDYTGFNGGQSDALKIMGPFTLPSTPFFPSADYHKGFIDSYYNSDDQTLDLQWEYLPTVTPPSVAIDGVALYTKISAAGPGDGRGECDKATSNGYVEVARTTNNWHRLSGITLVSLPNLKVLVCPYKGTEFTPDGVSPHMDGNTASKFRFFPKGGGLQVASKGVCKRVSLRLEGTSTMNTTPLIPITMTCTGDDGCEIYSTNNCTAGSSITTGGAGSSVTKNINWAVGVYNVDFSVRVPVATTVTGVYLDMDPLAISSGGAGVKYIPAESGYYIAIDPPLSTNYGAGNPIQSDASIPFNISSFYSGGVPPYTYTYISGSGSPWANNGTHLFTPDNSTGLVDIQVTDAVGATTDIYINRNLAVYNYDLVGGVPGGYVYTHNQVNFYRDCSVGNQFLATGAVDSPRIEKLCAGPIDLGFLLEAAVLGNNLYNVGGHEVSTSWSSGNTTLNTNVINDPIGSLVGDEIDDANVSTEQWAVYSQAGLSSGSNVDYVFSGFFKANTSNIMAIYISTPAVNCTAAVIDLSTQSITNTSLGCSFDATRVGIELVTDPPSPGWYRVWVHHNQPAGNSNLHIRIYPAYANSLVPTYNPAALGSVYVSGFQLQKGVRSPTTYQDLTGIGVGNFDSKIPDSLSSISSPDFSGYNPALGTIFMEWFENYLPQHPNHEVLWTTYNSSGGSVSDVTDPGTDGLALKRNSSRVLSFHMGSSASAPAISQVGGVIPTMNAFNKVAVNYDTNYAKLILNGGSLNISGLLPLNATPQTTFDRVHIGSDAGGHEYSANYKKFKYWNVKLHPEVMKQMTMP